MNLFNTAFRQYSLTSCKVINYYKCLFSKKLGLTACRGMPTRLFIEIINECNLKCSFCATGLGILKRKQTCMDFSFFKQIIDELYPYLIEVNFSGYGEPLLHKDIIQMVDYAKRKRLRVWFPTNMLLLTKELAKALIESGLDQITVSLDSSSENGYKKHKRGGSIQKTINNLSMLQQLKKEMHKKNPLLRINFVLMQHNENEIEAARMIAQKVEADIFHVKPANFDVSGYGEEKIRSDMMIERSDKVRQKQKDISTFRCPWLWNTIMVFADGSVGPCCFDAHCSLKLGNAFHEPIHKLWNNIHYKDIRYKVKNNIAAIPLCEKCPSRNEYEYKP